ncbi:MAG: RsmD family RNA methyltransferase [Alphaproteobacteria bacterium]|nr:RsmD family RNA methyltransferase [Alphaproteobacteria bacterium]
MRIVAGRLKGERIEAPQGRVIRPTSDRARSALFNILEHNPRFRPFTDCIFLDGFCGTGAVGLEAYSRGAARVWLIDSDLRLATHNVSRLCSTAETKLLRHDFSKPLANSGGTVFDFAFLDPPYGSGLVAVASNQLVEAGFLAPNSVVIAEVERDEVVAKMPRFELIFARHYGRARFDFWSLQPEA